MKPFKFWVEAMMYFRSIHAGSCCYVLQVSGRALDVGTWTGCNDYREPEQIEKEDWPAVDVQCPWAPHYPPRPLPKFPLLDSNARVKTRERR